jgi:hypothetical protein
MAASVSDSSKVVIERRDEIAAIRPIVQAQNHFQSTAIHPACQGKPSGVFAQDAKIIQDCREKERVGRTRAVGQSKGAAKKSGCRDVVSSSYESRRSRMQRRSLFQVPLMFRQGLPCLRRLSEAVFFRFKPASDCG